MSKKQLSEAEARALLAEVTMETEQKLQKAAKSNRKIIGVIVAVVAVCVAGLVIVLVETGTHSDLFGK